MSNAEIAATAEQDIPFEKPDIKDAPKTHQSTEKVWGMLKKMLYVLMAISALNVINIGLKQATGAEFLAGPVSVPYSFVSNGTMLASIILYCMFVQRAMKNIRTRLGIVGRMKPFMVWAWNFVPIFALWKPMIGVRQLLSITPTGELDEDAKGAVNHWWYAWVAAFIVAISAVGTISAETAEATMSDAELEQHLVLIGLIVNVAFFHAFRSFLDVGDKINAIQTRMAQTELADAFS